MNTNEQQYKQRFGSFYGLLGTISVGFAIYFFLKSVPKMNIIPSYKQVVSTIDLASSQIQWFLMNFTEANFYAGAISSAFLLIGGAVAWQLSVRKSKFTGFEICYGNGNIWPWIFASQVLSLLLTEYIFGYLYLFEAGMTWVPTFIVLVSVPASMLLLYGPSIKNLITVSFIGGAICTPVASWISSVTGSWNIPGAVSNVLAMALVGIVAGCICNVIPWMERVPVKPVNNTNERKENFYSASWLMRRTIADLTEPLFYGNDIVAVFLLVGVCIEWILNPELATGGAMMLPAIILSQFISGGLGVYLYTNKYVELGWYATYVPVVCTAPACILMFGATMPIIIISSVLGALIGAPLAEFANRNKPEYIHGTVGNVISMAVSTVIVAAVIECIPWI